MADGATQVKGGGFNFGPYPGPGAKGNNSKFWYMSHDSLTSLTPFELTENSQVPVAGPMRRCLFCMRSAETCFSRLLGLCWKGTIAFVLQQFEIAIRSYEH